MTLPKNMQGKLRAKRQLRDDKDEGMYPYLDGFQAQVNALRELQSQTQEELDALLPSPSVASGIPSVLRPQGGAFKGGL